ncbi:RGCVC family protein [Saccharothrix sp. Mg75]|uniref:RGCVC family protein n=1 Tax=Saccharothrix sp. Mg75 TaxID=3445357 RepID=UPI003EECF900
MSTTELLTDDLSTPGTPVPCSACHHPVDAHDPLARRFCSATEAGGLSRGCLCSGESSGATYGKTVVGNISDRAGGA